MQAQQHRPQTEVEPVPEQISSAEGKLVYLYLSVTNGASPAELTETLSVKKIAALSILNTLSKKGLVERDGTEYVIAN